MIVSRSNKRSSYSSSMFSVLAVSLLAVQTLQAVEAWSPLSLARPSRSSRVALSATAPRPRRDYYKGNVAAADYDRYGGDYRRPQDDYYPEGNGYYRDDRYYPRNGARNGQYVDDYDYERDYQYEQQRPPYGRQQAPPPPPARRGRDYYPEYGQRRDYYDDRYDADYYDDAPYDDYRDDYYDEPPPPPQSSSIVTTTSTSTNRRNLNRHDDLMNDSMLSRPFRGVGRLSNMMDRLMVSAWDELPNMMMQAMDASSKAFSTMVLQDNELDMASIYDDAEWFLEQDATCADLLGLPLRLDHPYSQCSATTTINGQSQSRTELQFTVDGQWNSGLVHLVATQDGILNMVLLVDEEDGGPNSRGYSRINVNVDRDRRSLANMPSAVDNSNVVEAEVLDEKPMLGAAEEHSRDNVRLLPGVPPRVPPAVEKRVPTNSNKVPLPAAAKDALPPPPQDVV